MVATLNKGPDEGTGASCHTADVLTDFGPFITAEGTFQYPVPETGREPADHPPMMFNMGSEDILSLEL